MSIRAREGLPEFTKSLSPSQLHTHLHREAYGSGAEVYCGCCDDIDFSALAMCCECEGSTDFSSLWGSSADGQQHDDLPVIHLLLKIELLWL